MRNFQTSLEFSYHFRFHSYLCRAAMNKLIQNTTIVYLALIMLVRMVAMPLTLLDYSMNKGYIAETLCENKSRPEVHCFGKCYLNKQLAKAAEGQDAKGQKGNTKNASVDFFQKSTYSL